jgi:anti-sigma regulatory factor (Ser/Thr protein kinase)
VNADEHTRGRRSITLQPNIDAPGRARQFAVDAAANALDAPTLDALRLLATELVANVVVHAHTPMRLSVAVDGKRVRVEVSDDVPPNPLIRPAPGDAYGLRLVDALATSWGVDAAPSGKTVWFELVGDDEDGDHRPN